MIVAVPCASASASERCRAAADHFVSLVVDPQFTTIRAYYDEFAPVSDHEVVSMLARAAEHVPNDAPTGRAR